MLFLIFLFLFFSPTPKTITPNYFLLMTLTHEKIKKSHSKLYIFIIKNAVLLYFFKANHKY